MTACPRSLLLGGVGRLPILDHCVQVSPESALVQAADYLGMDGPATE